MNMDMIIVDGNNWFRRRAETDIMGTPVRNCFYELQNKPVSVVCVWDGFNALERRRLIFPDYKRNRVPAGDNIYESQNMLKKLLNLSKVVSVQVDGYEGDDVIAAIAERYKGKANIYIESNDLDLYQLGLPMSRDKFPDTPRWIQLLKTMVGDSSDNIPGAKGFGKKSWEGLSDEQKHKLETIIVSGHGLTEDEIQAQVGDFFPSKALTWFKSKENRKLLLDYYKIVGYVPVPWDLIEKNMVPGHNQPDLAEPVFQEYMI